MPFTFGGMEEEKQNTPGKESKRKGLSESIRISISSYEKLKRFSDKNKTSMKAVVDELISFIDRPNFSMSILEDRYELHQMNLANKETHKLSNANFNKFKDDFLQHYDKSNSNTLNLLNKVIPKLIEISAQEEIKMLVEQNYKLSRALVSLEMDERDAKRVLYDTENTVIEFHKNKNSDKKTAEQKEEKKTNTPEPFITLGTIKETPTVGHYTNKDKFYCIFYLNKNMSDVKYNGEKVLLEGDSLKQKLGLTTPESVRNYFGNFQKGDYVQLKGYLMLLDYKRNNGESIPEKTFYVTDVMYHRH